jgi:predicted nuclease of predicted toxin-antitoxin system
MLRLLADENFNGDIVRGLLLRQPTLDVVRVQDVGLIGTDDSEILAWAAENNRIVLTHDRATMPD